jgi:glycosyltransferase involved in cell wall biosynthesis
MLEAMACGTPVLATPVGAIPDVIKDGETGFIMGDNSIECIRENVIRVLNSPDLERIAEKGRRFVEENYTFEKTVERWEEILKNLQ